MRTRRSPSLLSAAALALLLPVACLIPGCGGGKSGSDTGQGSVRFVVEWPDLTREIPRTATVIKVGVIDTDAEPDACLYGDEAGCAQKAIRIYRSDDPDPSHQNDPSVTQPVPGPDQAGAARRSSVMIAGLPFRRHLRFDVQALARNVDAEGNFRPGESPVPVATGTAIPPGTDHVILPENPSPEIGVTLGDSVADLVTDTATVNFSPVGEVPARVPIRALAYNRKKEEPGAQFVVLRYDPNPNNFSNHPGIVWRVDPSERGRESFGIRPAGTGGAFTETATGWAIEVERRVEASAGNVPVRVWYLPYGVDPTNRTDTDLDNLARVRTQFNVVISSDPRGGFINNVLGIINNVLGEGAFAPDAPNDPKNDLSATGQTIFLLSSEGSNPSVRIKLPSTAEPAPYDAKTKNDISSLSRIARRTAGNASDPSYFAVGTNSSGTSSTLYGFGAPDPAKPTGARIVKSTSVPPVADIATNTRNANRVFVLFTSGMVQAYDLDETATTQPFRSAGNSITAGADVKSLTVDDAENVYVLYSTNVVRKYSAAGVPDAAFNTAFAAYVGADVALPGNPLKPERLGSVKDIAFDSDPTLGRKRLCVLSDTPDGGRVHVFDDSGRYQFSYQSGTGGASLNAAFRIAADAGKIYVLYFRPDVSQPTKLRPAVAEAE